MRLSEEEIEQVARAVLQMIERERENDREGKENKRNEAEYKRQ